MQPGDVIDSKYRVELQLGEGGMGRVLAASHMALGSTVAIKVLKADALRHPEVPARFLREARAAGRLRSEHVVKVMDVGQLPSGEPFMVMEMLHGEDIATILKNGPVPAPLAVEYIVQACEGLAEAHALGMVHRDIKPANLFVTKRPNGAPLVKLLDFGIATAAYGEVDHKLTSTQTVIGSPSYMSPEQLRAARDVDARSDVWSLGITLFELLVGEQPFTGPTLTALTLKIVGEAHPRIDGIPDELNAVIDRCLAKERSARFPNVAELARELAPLFPNGRIAADMVAGSLSQPVAPTLMGSSRSNAGIAATAPSWPQGSQPVGWPQVVRSPSQSVGAVRPPTMPPALSSTTGMAAGESAAIETMVGSKRRWWIALGAAVIVGGVGVGAVLGMQRNTSSSSTPAAASQPAPPVASPPTPAPVETPAPTPTTPTATPIEPAPEPPVATPVPVDTKVERPKKRPPRSKDRSILRPKDLASDPPKDPPKDPPIDLKKPPDPPTPKKAPSCAPNDPACGL